MFRKRISSLLVALAALDATSALGLGLGEITLRSALNEPLKAEIRLRGTDDLGSDQIIVRLAPSADFDRSGIERLYALTEMRFEVKTSASGEGVVHLRTDQPVREPYLDFLLEVRWPNGRVLREYTVLLDLPTYTTAPPPEVRTPVTRAPARPSVTPRSDGGGAWSGGNSYGVQSGDTLWSIAARTRGDGVPVQQMLEALHQDNPDAFVNGDINRLRAGAVLRIPAELSSGSGAGAQPSAPDADAGGEQQSTGASSEPPADAGSERPYLRLTGDTQADAGGGSAGGEPGGSGTGSATDDLAAVQETLSAKERENAELASRVKALEEQVKDYQRVVDLKSEGMAAAQQSAGAATAPSVPAAASAAPPAPPPAPVEEPGVLDAVLENGVALGAAVIAAVLATLGFLVVRRRRSAPGYAPLPSASQRFRSSAREEAGSEPSAIEPVVPPVRQAPVRVEPTPVPVVAVAPIVAEAPVAPETPPAALSAKPLDLSKATPAVLPDEPYDPLAEADMFVAYGRHERAMEVLRVALEQDPEQIDIRLKLMEILASRNAQEEFLAEYDRVLALGGDDDVLVARTIAIETGHPHWLSELDAPSDIQSAGTVTAPSLALSRSLAPLVEEDHEPELSSLDLDLQSPVPEPATGEFDLDLDASLDEAALDSVELDVLPADDHGEFGDLELGSLQLDEPDQASDAALAGQPSTLHEELPLALDVATYEDTVHLDVDLPGLAEVAVADPVELASAPTEEDVADIDLLEGTDEVETRIELAKAFIEMGDSEGARDILEEVVAEGTEAQRASASALLDTLNPG